MLRFLLQRLATLIPTLIGITLVAFGLIRLVPGDPVEVMMGERRLDPEQHAEMLHRLGLDQPLHVQYLDYVGRLLHGDLGQSLISREAVSKDFVALFPATVELSLAALIPAVSLGLVLGVSAALKRGSLLDQRRDGRGHRRLFDAGVLVGPDPDHVLLGPTRLDAGLGRIGIEYDPERVTGFMLIDAWLSGGKAPSSRR